MDYKCLYECSACEKLCDYKLDGYHEYSNGSICDGCESLIDDDHKNDDE